MTPAELINTTQDLHPDLREYIETTDELGWILLKHPLVFGVPYTEQLNALYNEQYRCKKERLKESEDKEKWDSYIYLHERPYRFNALYAVKDKIKDHQEYWQLLASVWTDSENLWQVQRLLSRLLDPSRPGREAMMGEDERELLSSLPDEFLIYRGHQKNNQKGYSWTLSFWKARWFAKRFQVHGYDGEVSYALCNKSKVIALLLGRNEVEVAINPKNLKIGKVPSLRRGKLLAEIYKLAQSEFELSSGSMHGPWHWEKVERNAIALCKNTPGADMLVCRLFALLHDCKRQNENDDPEHGKKSAKFVESLYNQGILALNKEQVERLVEACRGHNEGGISADPTIGICWDADRLDLVRVGIVPSQDLLSTAAAKQLVWRI
jgi:hypothetical protein